MKEKDQERRRRRDRSSLTDRTILVPAIGESFMKLDPRLMARNPVMFVVEVGSVITTIVFVAGLFTGAPAFSGSNNELFVGQISIWLWFTVLFANFAEAVAEGRGKAQAAALRKTRSETIARRLVDGNEERVPSTVLRKGDLVVCAAGDDRSAVPGGTRVRSDRIVVQISANPGETFLDRMIGLVESASRRKTRNEIALNILLAALTIIFMFATVTLEPSAIYAGTTVTITLLIALLVCLIPTTIGGLLSAIGIAGIDRLLQRNVVALSGRAVEAAGDVDTLLLDKTGTITYGNRQASEFIPAPGVPTNRLIEAAELSSLADETPEGKSIVALARRLGPNSVERDKKGMTFIAFSATTRMSGVDFDSRVIRKGADDAMGRWSEKGLPTDVRARVDAIGRP